jgi:hypothetical protein
MSVVGADCTTRFENAHRIIVRELLYQYHPWSGRSVSVHEVIEKTDGVVFRCTLSGSEADRGLEIPAWMFDRTVCPDQPPLIDAPFVSVGALAALSTLLDLALKDGVASSNVPLSSASKTSRDQNRGEAHGRQNRYVSEQAAARSAAAEAAADGSVQGRHGRQRNRRPRMARAPGRGPIDAVQLDSTADPRSCREDHGSDRKGGRP